MRKINTRRRQDGFSLVELMIGLVISVATVGGIFSIYLNATQSQNFTQANSRVQESGRFAMEYLSRDIRMIGYRGCVSNTAPITNVVATNIPVGYNPLQLELAGYEIKTNWSTDTPFANATAISNRIRTGTHAISVSRMASLGAQLAENLSDNAANIKINTSSNLGLKKLDIIYISDCANADIFSITNIPIKNNGITTITHATGTNTSNNLSKAYQSNANIAKYQSHLYFVGDTTRKNSLGATIYALYQAEIDYSKSPTKFIVNELIEGVENMQLLYGEVLDTNNVKYVSSSNVSDMNNVSSVQLGLLITSQEQVRQTEDDQTYHLSQQAITTTGDSPHELDRRLRHVFNSTIQIRNRRL
jgi:type IV pilus assembly protein PilW